MKFVLNKSQNYFSKFSMAFAHAALVKTKIPNEDLLDKFFPCRKVAKVQKMIQKPEKDAIELFRPPSGYCLDYNISQTYAKFDVGDKKVSVRQTTATYVTAKKPKIKRKVSYSHSRPPCYEYQNEIINRKIDKQQEFLKAHVFDAQREKQQGRKKKSDNRHAILQEMAGPEWFQELSPKQLVLLETLRKCIEYDLLCNSIERCKHFVAKLGLVLRPNPKCIEKALKLSCGVPEEFLLQLYNFINPKRTQYSINDRLLISSVVHLSMENTLRELHVRIPSPPKKSELEKPPRKNSKNPLRTKRTIPKSPYLERVVFKMTPKKHCRIKRIFRPYIPYFNYIPNMRKDIKNNTDIFEIKIDDIKDEKELELIEETKVAQVTYNETNQIEKGVNLLKPSIYVPELLCNTEGAEDKDNKVNKKDVKHKKKIKKPKKFKSKSKKDIDNNGSVKGKSTSRKRKSLEKRADDTLFKDALNQCNTLNTEETEIKEIISEEKKEIPCWTKPPDLKYPDKCLCYMPNTSASPVIGGGKLTPSGHMIPVIQGIRENKCECLNHYNKEIEKWEKEKVLAKTRLNIKSQDSKLMVVGVVCTPEGPIYILGGVVNPTYNREGFTLEDFRKELATFDVKNFDDVKDKVPENAIVKKPKEPCERQCDCKNESKKFIDRQCKCEQCQATDRRKNPFFVSGGTLETSEGIVPIISGVCIRRCKCLDEYNKRIEEFEYSKAMKLAKRALREQKEVKHVIGGVSITKEGPVFNITGIKPKLECKCKDIYFNKLEESNQRQSNYVDDNFFVSLENPPPKPKIVSNECRVCRKHYENFVQKQCNCAKCIAKRNMETGTMIYSGTSVDPCGRIIPIVGGMKQPTCSCFKEYQERIKEYEYALCGRDKIRELRKQNLIINGILQGKDCPEYVLGGVYQGKDRFCSSDDSTEFFISQEDKQIMEVCKCKDALQKFFSKKCRCKKCIETRKRKKMMPDISEKSIKSETVSSDDCFKFKPKTTEEDCFKYKGDVDENTEDNNNYTNNYFTDYNNYNTNYNNYHSGSFGGSNADYSLEGSFKKESTEDFYEEKKCPCLLNYVEKLQFYEEYKKRMAAMMKIKSQSDKYVLGGVVNTKNGPVYLISGIRKEPDCKCAKVIKKQLENKQMVAIMPNKPGGRVTYTISGVKETPNGNVFILSEAKDIQECPCMEMFRKFEAAHTFCSDFYDKYLNQMEDNIKDYLLELDHQREIYREEKEIERIDGNIQQINFFVDECKKLIKDNELFMKPEDVIPPLPFEVNADCLYPKIVEVEDDVEEEPVNTRQSSSSSRKRKSSEVRTSQDFEVKHKKSKSEKTNPQDNKKLESEDSRLSSSKKDKNSEGFNKRRKSPAELEGKERKMSINPNSKLKRFFISKNFPKDPVEQMKLLKDALETLAEDGFYIAKLPDCHKLPHFKLWLDLRSGKTWTPKDSLNYWSRTKSLTNLHIEYCYDLNEISVPLSKQQLKEATWRNSQYYKALIAKLQNEFYRKTKQSIINNSREFYPALFLYEFYSERIRNTFFAFTPAKEEEVFPYRIVQMHEFFKKNK
ncbi:unnamed protein product [Brassicogethes aeneus]|uniref:Uncharacterized protein n=1 Tax=Brassicogethes aeneus TaxID=1431903 RepID=A0A9P0BD06_BRAAE|nr:unnamed protein product [Brassicogethes aeneus]